MKLSQFRCDDLKAAIRLPLLNARAIWGHPDLTWRLDVAEHIWQQVRIALNVEEAKP